MSKTTHLILIAGIRSQFVKVAALLYAIEKHNQNSLEKILVTKINTGQHYDDVLYSQMIRDLNLTFDFQITHESHDADAIIAHSFMELSKYFKNLDSKNFSVVVFGDGNPSMIGALVAARYGFKIIHVESGEKRAKHEHEEINRRVIDSLSDIHFCVSQRAVRCLSEEGLTEGVLWTGDLAYEFMQSYIKNILVLQAESPNKDFILVTIHRPENLHPNTLSNIVEALEKFPKKALFVCHPHTYNLLNKIELTNKKNIEFVNALSYSEMLLAIKRCFFLFTDSGGLIRESSHLGKRCVVMRKGGGWPELIQAGYNIRVGTQLKEIEDALSQMNILSQTQTPPPEILYRKNGIENALNLICSLQ